MRVVVILAALHLSAGFMTPPVQPGMLRSSAASRGLLSLACDRRPPVAPARLASSAVPQNMASGDGGGGKGKWGDPPVEIVDDAVDRAVTLIKASGGSMDSLSFGAAWKVAYPTYDKDVFKNTCVTSFTKLLQVRLQALGLQSLSLLFLSLSTHASKGWWRDKEGCCHPLLRLSAPPHRLTFPLPAVPCRRGMPRTTFSSRAPPKRRSRFTSSRMPR